MKKNVSGQVIGAQMIDASDGSAFTGTVSVAVTVDGGTQGAGGGAVTHEGGGFHSYAATQAETNGNHIAFTFSGTGAIPVTIQVYTNYPQSVDNDVLNQTIDGKIDTVKDTDLPAVKADTAAILIDTADMQPKITEIQTNVDTIETDTQDIQNRLPSVLVGGKMDSHVNDIAANAVSNTAIADNAITAAKIAANAITSSEIADNAITAAKISTGAITSAKFASNSITAAALATDAVTEIQTGLATAANLQTVDDNVDSILADTADMQPKVTEIQTNVDAIETKINTIDSNLDTVKDTDLPAVKADTAAILIDTDEIQGKLPTGNIADQTTSDAIETDTQDIQTKIGTPTDTDLATDIANVQTVVDSINLTDDAIKDIKSIISGIGPNGVIKFVDKNAAGTGSGDDWTNAYTTIAAATAAMSSTDGGVIYIKAAEYAEQVVVPDYTSIIGIPGPADSHFAEIRGKGVTADGPTLTLGYGSKAINIRTGRASGGSYSDCVIKMQDHAEYLHGSTGGISGDPVDCLFLDDGVGGVMFNRIIGNQLAGSSVAKTLFGGEWNELTFKQNRIWTFTEDYISNDALSSGIFIEDNMFRDVQSGYYYIKSDADRINAKNNMYDLADGGGWYSAGAGSATTKLQNNEQYCNKSDAKGGDAIYDKTVDVETDVAAVKAVVDTTDAAVTAVAEDITTIGGQTEFLRKLETNKKEFVEIGGEWYLKVYDDGSTTTEILTCKVEKYGGGAIDTLVGTGTPSVRFESTN